MSEKTMTPAEQSIADDKMRAEIAKLIAESLKLQNEARHFKMQSIVAPFMAAATVIGATAAIVKIFF